jgi:hypothetical protein
MSDAKRRLSIAITGATLIDGTRRPPLANATIVIDGDRIARAARRRSSGGMRLPTPCGNSKSTRHFE